MFLHSYKKDISRFLMHGASLRFFLGVAAVFGFAQPIFAGVFSSEKAEAAGYSAELLNPLDSKNIIEKFKAEGSDTREWLLDKTSEAYIEDNTNPALKLERIWVNNKGTMLRVIGLRRKQSQYSAVIDMRELKLFNLNTKRYFKYISHIGGVEVKENGKSPIVQLKEGESLYIFLEPINDMEPYSLRYRSGLGAEDSYFDKIDPRFKERYGQLYAKASAENATVADLKDFLLQFSNNDPDNKAKSIFVKLINNLRGQKTFDGYYQAYMLVKDPADATAAKSKASTPAQLAKINSAILDEKQGVRQSATREETKSVDSQDKTSVNQEFLKSYAIKVLANTQTDERAIADSGLVASYAGSCRDMVRKVSITPIKGTLRKPIKITMRWTLYRTYKPLRIGEEGDPIHVEHAYTLSSQSKFVVKDEIKYECVPTALRVHHIGFTLLGVLMGKSKKESGFDTTLMGTKFGFEVLRIEEVQ